MEAANQQPQQPQESPEQQPQQPSAQEVIGKLMEAFDLGLQETRNDLRTCFAMVERLGDAVGYDLERKQVEGGVQLRWVNRVSKRILLP